MQPSGILTRTVVVWLSVAALFACRGQTATVEADALPGEDALGSDQVERPSDVHFAPPDTSQDTGIDVWNPLDVDGKQEADVWSPLPCQSHEDCDDGFCVEAVPGSGETVCTVTCIEECPLDWVCKSVHVDGPDPVSICLPPGDTLCRGCQQDTDCILAGSLCIKGEAALGFCGKTCSVDGAPCPEGFECTLYVATSGQVQGYQCMPAAGSCCAANEWESCDDDNPCTFDGCAPGLGCTHEPTDEECSGDDPCQAYVCEEGECVGTPVTVDDTLDGIDSDCDGAVDEDAYKAFRLVTGDFAAGGGPMSNGDAGVAGHLVPVAGAAEDELWIVKLGLAALRSFLAAE